MYGLIHMTVRNTVTFILCRSHVGDTTWIGLICSNLHILPCKTHMQMLQHLPLADAILNLPLELQD